MFRIKTNYTTTSWPHSFFASNKFRKTSQFSTYIFNLRCIISHKISNLRRIFTLRMFVTSFGKNLSLLYIYISHKFKFIYQESGVFSLLLSFYDIQNRCKICPNIRSLLNTFYNYNKYFNNNNHYNNIIINPQYHNFIK